MRPLTEQGAQDSLAVAEFLRGVHVDRFICSNYTRSIQTITPAAEERGMEIIIDERLRERDGTLAGAGMGETRKRWLNMNYVDEGGENIRSVQRRNIEAMRDILELFAGQTLVIGTHGTAFSALMNYYDGAWNYVQFRRIVNMLPAVFRVRFAGQCMVDWEQVFALERGYPKAGK